MRRAGDDSHHESAGPSLPAQGNSFHGGSARGSDVPTILTAFLEAQPKRMGILYQDRALAAERSNRVKGKSVGGQSLVPDDV
jgi:hypothetical protein